MILATPSFYDRNPQVKNLAERSRHSFERTSGRCYAYNPGSCHNPSLLTDVESEVSQGIELRGRDGCARCAGLWAG